MIYNFSAGPATLPIQVLEQLQTQMLDFKGKGYSLIEASHRSKVYEDVHNNAIALIKELLHLGNDYTVLFLGGGATLQFAMLAYNFVGKRQYINTGSWATVAIDGAKQVIAHTNQGTVDVIYDGATHNFTAVPTQSEYTIDPHSRYVHLTSNETIDGIQYKNFPNTAGVPLVADMSSDILSTARDYSKFSLFYAGAQKNLGPAGLTIVVVKNSFLESAEGKLATSTDLSVGSVLPTYLSYKVHAKKNSLLNTPPVFAIWALELVLAYYKSIGGIAAIEASNKKKSTLLYNCIDASGSFYRSPVKTAYRSDVNIVFRLKDEALEEQFVKKATAHNLIGLKGHRSVGGIRASVYNAMPLEGVQALVKFMNDFITQHS